MGGATDLLQLIDDGVGFHVKNEMGKLLDLWLTEDNDLEPWMSEDGRFPIWKKRVLITDLLAQAWKMCARETRPLSARHSIFWRQLHELGTT